MLATVLLAGCDGQQAEAPAAPREAIVVQPRPTEAVRYLHETGVAKASERVDLVARVSGFLKSIDYKDGSEVKAGQRLFLIEPDIYEAQVAQAEASLGQANITLENAQKQLQRQTQLVRTAATPQVNLENAKTTEASSSGQLASAKASLTQARLNLAYTSVTAPFDGHVTEHQADVGALVGSGGATTLATIVRLDPIHVSFSISDADMLRIRKEMREKGLTRRQVGEVPVEIGTKIDDGYPIKGRLDYTAPETSPDTGTLSVRAIFDNPDRRLLPGLFVKIRIPVETIRDALLVPPSAIGTDQEGRYVLVVDERGGVARRAVTLLGRDGELQQVRGALGADDRVLRNVLSGPRAGDTVIAREAAEPQASDARQSVDASATQ